MSRSLTSFFKLDTREFDYTLRKYAELSRHTPAEICNKKAYYIVRRAIWYTPQVPREQISEELEAHEAFELHINKSGKNAGKYSRAGFHRTLALGSSQNPNTPRAVKILVARLRAAGQAIPDAAKLLQMAVRMVKARLRSSGFLKVGWIDARNTFHVRAAEGSGLPPNDPTLRRRGRPKGGGRRAEPRFWKVAAEFWNLASFNRENKGALQKYGGPAFQKAVQEETKSMAEEVERRLKEHAHTAGIKVT